MGRQIGSEMSKVLMSDACSSVITATQIRVISFSLLIIEVINNIRFHDIEPIKNNSNYL